MDRIFTMVYSYCFNYYDSRAIFIYPNKINYFFNIGVDWNLSN